MRACAPLSNADLSVSEFYGRVKLGARAPDLAEVKQSLFDLEERAQFLPYPLSSR